MEKGLEESYFNFKEERVTYIDEQLRNSHEEYVKEPAKVNELYEHGLIDGLVIEEKLRLIKNVREITLKRI